jgi:hypothetical protein
MQDIVYHFLIQSYLEKKRVTTKTPKCYMMRKFKRISKNYLVQLISIDNKEDLRTREVHNLLIFLKKRNLPKGRPQTAVQEKRESSMDNSNDEREQNPPKGNLERPHKLPVTSKRKRGTNKKGETEGIPEEEIILEDMDLDVNIEDIEFLDEEQRMQESREIAT